MTDVVDKKCAFLEGDRRFNSERCASRFLKSKCVTSIWKYQCRANFVVTLLEIFSTVERINLNVNTWSMKDGDDLTSYLPETNQVTLWTSTIDFIYPI